jgi:putative Ca2+/H+ antiporter (TMEM165/GDT1 family)
MLIFFKYCFSIQAIALAADDGVWPVTIGGLIGHSLCTGGAVLGGRLLATKISVKTGDLLVFDMSTLLFTN